MNKIYKNLVDLIQSAKDQSDLNEMDFFNKANNPPLSKSYFYALKKMANGETPRYEVGIGTIIEAYRKLGYKGQIILSLESVGELSF